MTSPFSPERWAFEITHVLNAVLGAEHFPINVKAVAQEYSAQKFPDDPISRIVGDSLPGFDGALYKAPAGKKGWGIFYNSQIRSTGRVNFTLAHEFGHYLLHRLAYPDGIRCGEQDFVQWDSQYGQVEHQANVFAANLLMPLDDFRRLVPPDSAIDLDILSACTDRYRVSLIAAALRWLSYTEKRAVLVVSRDGFILWARSSAKALRTGGFFRTSVGPIAIPVASLAAQESAAERQATRQHDRGIWFPEPVTEMTVLSEQYDFAISLLLLPNDPPPFEERLRIA
ncbi:ImmA/IrrE family metallo-endopeptidase [Bradyrhizobium oligotrophicum S58]